VKERWFRGSGYVKITKIAHFIVIGGMTPMAARSVGRGASRQAIVTITVTATAIKSTFFHNPNYSFLFHNHNYDYLFLSSLFLYLLILESRLNCCSF
jgi:hypothetical protein